MGILELVLVAVSLSMDAFAVAICKGLSMTKLNLRQMATVGIYFGAFQMVMPLIGFFLGTRFSSAIEAYDHWVVFILLALIGLNMIHESFKKEEAPEEAEDDGSVTGVRAMLPLALATSVDALAVGITFAILSVNIVPAVTLIGVTTLVLSMTGVMLGSRFGSKYKARAEIAGGVVLILIGLKVLLEHLGVISF